MEWLAEKINKIVENLLLLLVSAMTVIVFIQVVFRYFVNFPLFWTEEAARFIMIWIVFTGASVGIRRGSHLGFTYFVDKASVKIKKWLALIVNLGLLAFCINITYYGTIITLQNLSQLSGGLGIPIAWVYLCLPVSGILSIIQLAPIMVKLAGFLQNSGYARDIEGGN